MEAPPEFLHIRTLMSLSPNLKSAEYQVQQIQKSILVRSSLAYFDQLIDGFSLSRNHLVYCWKPGVIKVPKPSESYNYVGFFFCLLSKPQSCHTKVCFQTLEVKVKRKTT